MGGGMGNWLVPAKMEIGGQIALLDRMPVGRS